MAEKPCITQPSGSLPPFTSFTPRSNDGVGAVAAWDLPSSLPFPLTSPDFSLLTALRALSLCYDWLNQARYDTGIQSHGTMSGMSQKNKFREVSAMWPVAENISWRSVTHSCISMWQFWFFFSTLLPSHLLSFGDKVSHCNPRWSQICNLAVSSSQVLELSACTTIPCSMSILIKEYKGSEIKNYIKVWWNTSAIPNLGGWVRKIMTLSQPGQQWETLSYKKKSQNKIKTQIKCI